MMLTCLNRSHCEEPLGACSCDECSLVQTLLRLRGVTPQQLGMLCCHLSLLLLEMKRVFFGETVGVFFVDSEANNH